MLKTQINSFLLLAGFILSISTAVQAVEVSKLDESIVSVETRLNSERKTAIRRGFEDVILKNTGNQSALLNPVVANQLKNASSLITQYGYYEKNGELFLQVSFDHERIITLLREAGLPVWGKQRPLTLIWVVVNEGDERTLLNDASIYESRTAYADEASSRGVPLLFPLMDLEDSMQVNVNDVRGMFTENVALASQRYQSDFFIMGSIEPKDTQYRYNMALYPKERLDVQHSSLIDISGEATDINTAVTNMIAAVSEFFVGQYAIADSGEELMTKVTFAGITEMKQLVDIEHYLRQLSAVKSASLTYIQGQTVEFSLDLFGNEEDLHRLMNLEPRVEVMNTEQNGPAGNIGFDSLDGVTKPVPVYRWQGR